MGMSLCVVQIVQSAYQYCLSSVAHFPNERVDGLPVVNHSIRAFGLYKLMLSADQFLVGFRLLSGKSDISQPFLET